MSCYPMQTCYSVYALHYHLNSSQVSVSQHSYYKMSNLYHLPWSMKHHQPHQVPSNSLYNLQHQLMSNSSWHKSLDKL